MPILPPLPGHRLRILSDSHSGDAKKDFLFVRKLSLAASFADGTESEPFPYFMVERPKLDAVVIVPHHRDASGRRWVVLRSALRPLAAMRSNAVDAYPEKDSLGELWEVPAGLVEPEERTPLGLQRCAQRELFEETGYQVALEKMVMLGLPTFPAPGVIGERHFFFQVEVDPEQRGVPSEDGSAVERLARVESVLLDDALAACSAGEIEDAKTELALYRLRAL